MLALLQMLATQLEDIKFFYSHVEKSTVRVMEFSLNNDNRGLQKLDELNAECILALETSSQLNNLKFQGIKEESVILLLYGLLACI